LKKLFENHQNGFKIGVMPPDFALRGLEFAGKLDVRRKHLTQTHECSYDLDAGLYCDFAL
jgi:hypothetical protein